jgi:ribosomal protein S2
MTMTFRFIAARYGKRCGMRFVCDRGVGGALTNFRTIRSRLTRLEELDALKTSDQLTTYSKKMQSALNREHRKMLRNLNGIRTMNRMPECLVVIDPKKERNAIREARSLGITTLALIDTDCDPDLVDLPIPATTTASARSVGAAAVGRCRARRQGHRRDHRRAGPGLAKGYVSQDCPKTKTRISGALRLRNADWGLTIADKPDGGSRIHLFIQTAFLGFRRYHGPWAALSSGD